MRPRGPDGAGLWMSGDGRVVLGHRRLSIIDLSSRAAQPMHSADGRLTISFNGEIYNYRELRADLEAAGRHFHSASDTEVLLQLYAQRGPEMVHALRGMFAFAIHDDAADQVFLARDPLGIKPLYYADLPDGFWFASTVKALLATGAMPAEPDPAGLVGLHLFGCVPEPYTLHRHVRALPAGHTLVVRGGRAEEPQRHFSVAQIYADACSADLADPADPADPAGAQAAVRAAVLESVGYHMVADVPVGAFLSSGIDSGALLGLMCERSPAQPDTRPTTITVAFDELHGGADDEVPLARELARHYGATHHVQRVTREDFEQDLPRILDAMDQPSIDGFNTWFVSKAAAEHGLKVAVSGLGGDELFGGYPSFTDLPRMRRLAALTSWAPAIGRGLRSASAPWLRRSARSPKLAGVLEYGASFAGAYLLRRGLFMPWELERVLDADLVEQGLRELLPLDHVQARLEPDPGSDFGRVATLETSLYMRDQLLRDTDWASMAHSLEVRVPLVDASLLRALAPYTPYTPHASNGNTHGKQLLARAPRPPLPQAVATRPKTGFTTPIGSWLQRSPLLDGWRRVPDLHQAHCPWARRLVVALAQRALEGADG